MELKIGILLPKSDMFPRLAIDFLNGFKLSFNSSDDQNYVPKFIIESTGNATDSSLLQRVERMLLQEETDVIVCFCSYFMLDSLVTIANSYRKPIIHVTLGARVLKPTHHSPYVLHVSLNLCQTSYLSGKYAAQHFGKKAALLSSFYDGGYQLTESFFQGFTDHQGEIVYNYVSPMDYKLETFDAMIEGLQQTNPEVLFSVFSYKEGNKVLAKLAQSGIDSIPTVAIPLMTDESNETEVQLPENFYSIASWAFGEDSKSMDDFNQNYQNKYSETPTIFSLLGDEVGTILSYCLQKENSIPNQLGTYFSNKILFTSRGELRFSKYNESIPQHFKLRKLVGVEGKFHNEVKEVFDSSFSDIIYNKMEELPYSGWKNPYICT
jgi:branched-chain amino acid transport system substrate-binding protein